MKRSVRSTGCVVLLALMSCRDATVGKPPIENSAMPPLTFSQADHDKSVPIKLGDIVHLTLNETPTTGFRWDIEEGNSAILEILSSEYNQPPGASVGGAGEHNWTFKARQAGNVRLVLKRWRAWEGDKSVAERFNITFRIAG